MYWNTKTCKKMGLLCFLVVMITVSFSLNATAKNKISVSVNGKRAIIMDMETEEVLYGKNIKNEIFIYPITLRVKKKCETASTTKLLTAITAEDRTSLSKKVRISNKVVRTEPTCFYFRQGDTYYMKELLRAMLIMSANDASVAVAEGSGGSVNRFLRKMNAKAKKIGCKNTHFATVNGLHTNKKHYTTAYDMALIVKYAYSNAEIRKILKKRNYTVKSTNGKKKKIKSTNILLNSKKYYCVGKTGTGSVARYCFAGVYTHKDHHYVLVTFGCDKDADRWMDVKRMINACRKYEKQRQTVEVQ